MRTETPSKLERLRKTGAKQTGTGLGLITIRSFTLLGRAVGSQIFRVVQRSWQSAAAPSLAAGTLVGFLMVSLALPWLLTWGSLIEFSAAAALALVFGLWGANRVIPYGTLRIASWGAAVSVWTLAVPSVLVFLTSLVGIVPTSLTAIPAARALFAMSFALPVWFFAGVCFSHLVAGSLEASRVRGSSTNGALGAMALGIATGVAGNVLWVGVAVGTTMVAVLCLCSCAGVILIDRMTQRNPTTNVGGTQLQSSRVNSHANSPAAVQTLSTVLIFALLGGLFSTTARLLGQLTPLSVHAMASPWIGLAVGCGIGLLAFRRINTFNLARRWVVLVAAAWSAILFLGFPQLTSIALWMNSNLTTVSVLLLARQVAWIVAMGPMGVAIAYGIVSLQSHHDRRDDSRLVASGHSLAIGLTFVSAMFATSFCSSYEGVFAPMFVALLGLILVAMAEVIRGARSSESAFDHRLVRFSAFAARVVLVALTIIVPFASSRDDAVRTTKLMFSTPAFVAHRSGWETPLLTQLDDTRMVARIEGSHGPITLWRSRGLELHLRDGGVPRSAMSIDPKTHPQFAPEVLQAALPLVIAEKPGRVLVLGASGGVPLAATLHFPVREAVCVEGDSRLMAMLRGPVSRELGIDPLADARVSMISAPPELMLMSRDDSKFDVILSASAPSSIASGSSSFTSEFYQRVSHRLSDRGLFCQRFESLDYGPVPLRRVAKSLRSAFHQVVAVETAVGEILFIAANFEGDLLPDDLPARLEAPHVQRLLARSGLDWSTPLNFPAYDHAALGEICDDDRAPANSCANALLALQAPLDMMRWGTKLQDVQRAFTAVRKTPAPYLNRTSTTGEATTPQNVLAVEVRMSRKSRFLDWLGDQLVSADLLRRLSEVATQQKLVRENPDSHWWEYRKALRQQLQERPRSSVQQVAYAKGEKLIHEEDVRRKKYFESLGIAASQPHPGIEEIGSIEACLEPYDPLMSYFARQEIADLLARSERDPSAELVHRLHVINFTPAADASTRNVVTAIELLVKHPEAIPDDARRFDVLNGLVQLLRGRWELRQNISVKSAHRQISDVNRSVVAIERAIESMNELHPSANVTKEDWASRRRVIDRQLLNPLRGYHAQLQAAAVRSKSEQRADIQDLGIE